MHSEVLLLRRLHHRAYEPVFAAMRAFAENRDADTLDELWWVEHPPVFTQGMAGKAGDGCRAEQVGLVQDKHRTRQLFVAKSRVEQDHGLVAAHQVSGVQSAGLDQVNVNGRRERPTLAQAPGKVRTGAIVAKDGVADAENSNLCRTHIRLPGWGTSDGQRRR